MEVIYKITNKINGKFYIGKTRDINKRWIEHLSKVGKKRHPLYDSILHYGKENFIIEIVDEAEPHLINELEKEWIRKTNAIELGYNFTEGGTGGDTFSNLSEDKKEERRLKNSKASKISNAKNIELHRQNSKKLWEDENYRNKVITSLKNRINDPVYKLKFSQSMKKTLMNSEMLKIWSECKKGNKNGRWLGYVIVTDLEGNEKKYESAVEVSKQLKTAAQNIRNHCVNNTTFQVGPYKDWKFRYEK